MTLSTNQQTFLDHVLNGYNIFLTGKAGTGKSFITTYAIEQLKKIGKKAQGLTFDEVTVDLTRPCFQKGQLYVALSRVRTPEGLRIITN